MAEKTVDHKKTQTKTSKDHFDSGKPGRVRVKHDILRYFLGGFLPKHGIKNEKVVYVDGFSGSGLFNVDTNEDKECTDNAESEGSPLVAYRATIKHKLVDRFQSVCLIFIEKDKSRVTELNNNLIKLEEDFKKNGISKANVEYRVIFGSFDQQMKTILDNYQDCPMLVFADPFNLKALPFTTMKMIVGRPNTEIFMNIMFAYENRCYKDFDKSFRIFLNEKNPDWKLKAFGNNEIPAPEKFISYYLSKLLLDIKRYHFAFEMRNNQNRMYYHLVFITECFKCFEQMKRAMTKNSQSTELLYFSEWRHQFDENALKDKRKSGSFVPINRSKEEVFEDIVKSSLQNFSGKSVFGKEIAEYITRDKTYLFKGRPKLKKRFKEFISKSNGDQTPRRFDDILYEFP